ncbi:hypothetical protein [Sinobaca sp. H24]|uniref:hypothetical protein n=1 Tax=Sinobaca sp. H24 TaxID=2923376 RepID=UPI002079BD72|nr:hypothetical protein [Sinobaca sp. H24]
MEPIVAVLLIGLILFLVFLLCFYFYLRLIKIKRFKQEEKLERVKKKFVRVSLRRLKEKRSGRQDCLNHEQTHRRLPFRRCCLSI